MNYDQLKIGKKLSIQDYNSKSFRISNIIKKTKRLFSKKFSLLVMLIDFQGELKFYLVNPKEGSLIIEGNRYQVCDKNIKKTNSKYNIICFNEGNPISVNLSHNSDSTISSKQLQDFMDSELTNKVLRALRTKKTFGFGFVQVLILIGVAFVALLLILNFLGIIDVTGFFMVGK